MESSEMELSEGTSCLGFTQMFNTSCSHLCCHHWNKSWLLCWKEGQTLQVTVPWQVRHRLVAIHLEKSC